MLANAEKNGASERRILKRISAIESEMSSILSSINLDASYATKKKKAVVEFADPSIQFIRAPLDVPTVYDAKSFFREIGYTGFRVHVGSVSGWRTVSIK